MRGSALAVTLMTVLVVLPSIGCITSETTGPSVRFPNFEISELRIERAENNQWRVSTVVMDTDVDDLRWSSLRFMIGSGEVVRVEVDGVPAFDESGTQEGYYLKGSGMEADIVEVGDTLVLTGLDDGVWGDKLTVWYDEIQEYILLDELGPILLDVQMESIDTNSSAGINATFRIKEIVPDDYTIFCSDLQIKMVHGNGTSAVQYLRIWKTMDGAPSGVYTYYLKDVPSNDVRVGDRLVLLEAPKDLLGAWVLFLFDDRVIGSVQVGPSPGG